MEGVWEETIMDGEENWIKKHLMFSYKCARILGDDYVTPPEPPTV